ncbi:MAG: restriction endonuclease [Gammaproteobacteria bacterium]|nr:restriction endonuclease [Gammaproteobacteria bacterium]
MKRRLFIIEEKSHPNLSGMMLATIHALKGLGDSGTIQEIEEKVIEQEQVTEEEQSFMMPDNKKPRLNYYLAWARTYLKRGNALENSSRGVWRLLENGSTITSLRETKKIYDQVFMEERIRSGQKKKNEQNESAEQINLEGSPDVSEDWKMILLNVLGEMKPDAFERLSQRLLREAGFTKVEVRGQSGDGGIDGVGVLRVNLVSFQVYFQCKRWKGAVTPKEIRDFRGALQGRADKGLFITTGEFTSHASDEATREGAIAIDLINGDRLCDLLKEHRLGIRVEKVESVEIQSEWFEKI